jgi:hypothetical protein
MNRVQARLEHQARVLQVAVAPAAIALQLGEQVRRHLLVAAVELVGDPDLPAGAPHQRGLDEIVRHHLARERARAGQRREARNGHERRPAQDRVVAPVVRFAELPEAHPGGEERPVGARRELLDAAVQRLVADRARRGLDDAGVGDALPSAAPASSGTRRS